MKALGIVLLVIGVLSLIGGLLKPSDSDNIIIIGGYVIKFGFIIGGIALIVKSNNRKNMN